MISQTKKELGQFFTTSNEWMQPQVVSFIFKSGMKNVLDPFAGGGDLLNQCKKFNFVSYNGLDKDTSFGWRYNDSLLGIPFQEDTIVITNPPYLYISSRANTEYTKKYFRHRLSDLYLEALYNILVKYEYCVAIIPGSFVKCCQNFPFYKRLKSITYISNNLFSDTTCPVCVVCFDNKNKGLEDIECYYDNIFISSLSEIEVYNYKYENKIQISNDDIGWLGCKLIDDIHFGYAQEFEKYFKTKLNNRRCYVKLSVDYRGNKDELISKLNESIDELMKKTKGLVLLPFKSSNRRRMVIEQAKGIVEKVILSLNKEEIGKEIELW